MRIASFDIGKKNFAFCIEEFDPDVYNKEEWVKIAKKFESKKSRYLIDGTPTPEFRAVLSELYLHGKVILLENIDLCIGCNKAKYLDPKTFINMNDVLDKYTEYWNTCDIFLIEQQMGFGKQRNPMALKLGQHCYSYFILKYRDAREIIEFPSYHKTQILGAGKIEVTSKKGKVSYKNMNKDQRKKWAIEHALDILAERGDFVHLAKLDGSKKKDDMSDCLLMIIAYKYLNLTKSDK